MSDLYELEISARLLQDNGKHRHQDRIVVEGHIAAQAWALYFGSLDNVGAVETRPLRPTKASEIELIVNAIKDEWGPEEE